MVSGRPGLAGGGAVQRPNPENQTAVVFWNFGSNSLRHPGLIMWNWIAIVFSKLSRSSFRPRTRLASSGSESSLASVWPCSRRPGQKVLFAAVQWNAGAKRDAASAPS